MMTAFASLLFACATVAATGTIALMWRDYGAKAQAALRLEHVPAATIARMREEVLAANPVRVSRERRSYQGLASAQPLRIAA